MPHAGQIALLKMTNADGSPGKERPVVLLARVPGIFDDWAVCMISSQKHQYLPGFDEIISADEENFEETGLQITSVVRIARLAVVHIDQLEGAIGEIAQSRLQRIRKRLAQWIQDPDQFSEPDSTCNS
jgi:mRNA interferase MazF